MKLTTFISKVNKAYEANGWSKGEYAYQYLVHGMTSICNVMDEETWNKRKERYNYSTGAWSGTYRRYINNVIEYATLIRPSIQSGMGAYCRINTYGYQFKRVFDAIGVKYETGNDAPRGGKCGEFIKITTKISINK